ncbi:MAG: hypothetical protein K0Q57_132 [Gammaproteobacteria bacterium]|jgi:hypothetical protein|nr:hypothetical protein [Gammaproteobacteria bacterium]
MFGLIQSIKTQIREHIEGQKREEIAAIKDRFIGREGYITRYQNILQAYVMPSDIPEIPEPSVGYIDPSQVKSPEAIQPFKDEVVLKLQNLKSSVAHPLLDKVVSHIEEVLNKFDSKATEFLCHRKRQFPFDKSDLRMANLLAIYYLVQEINSLSSAKAVQGIIESLIKLPSFADSDLTKTYIKVVLQLLKLAIQNSEATYLDEATKIKAAADQQISIASLSFDQVFINHAVEILDEFKLKILGRSSDELKQAYENFCARCEEYRRVNKELRDIRQNSHKNTLETQFTETYATLSLSYEDWPQDAKDRYATWRNEPAQSAKFATDSEAQAGFTAYVRNENMEKRERIVEDLKAYTDYRHNKHLALTKINEEKDAADLALNKLISKLPESEKLPWRCMFAIASCSVLLEHSVCIIEMVKNKEFLKEVLIQALKRTSPSVARIQIEPKFSAEGEIEGISISTHRALAEVEGSEARTPPRGGAGEAHSPFVFKMETPVASYKRSALERP